MLSIMDKDIEAVEDDCGYLTNTGVSSFSWEDVTVNVRDRATKRQKTLLRGINGVVRAGMRSVSAKSVAC
jgi:hypothetical protein